MKNTIIALRNWHKTFSVREQIKRHDLLGRWITIVVVIALALVICSQTLTPRYKRIALEDGATSSRSYRSPFPFTFVDPGETDRLRREAASRAPLHFQYDPELEARIEANIDLAISIIVEAKRDNNLTSESVKARVVDEIGDKISEQLGFTMGSAVRELALDFLPTLQFARQLKESVHTLLSEHGIISLTDHRRLVDHEERGPIRLTPAKPGGLPFNSTSVLIDGPGVKEALREQLHQYYETPAGDRDSALYQIGLQLLQDLLEPNISYNQAATERSQLQARNRVAGIEVQIRTDEVLVPRLQVIDDYHRAALDAYNAIVLGHRLKVLAGHLLIIIGIVFFVAAFLLKFHEPFEINTGNIIVVSFPILLALLIGRVALEFDSNYGGYFFLAGAIGIVGVITVDSRVAMMQVLAGSILFGLMNNLDFTFMIIAIFSGFTAIAALFAVRTRRDILIAGLWISLASVLTVLVTHYISDPGQRPNFWALLWALVNGALCSIIAYPVLVTCETLFDVVTDLRLLELTGGTHPALLDLEKGAPGSFQHSLSVTKLAEAAAHDIGANFLLARAGAYFHDIGKMVKPKYFGENQVTPDERSIHRELTPHMSALIIKNHVKEGLELARKYGLPRRVADFISQHQGTTLIRYSYNQALKQYEESSAAEPVDEAEFRYPGPKPQFIEAAVVMLADSIEATATSKLTGAQVRDDDIRLLVRDTINEKFAEDQFDECPLTLRDLYLMGESFVRTLRARYHFRVQYPDKKTAAPKNKNGH